MVEEIKYIVLILFDATTRCFFPSICQRFATCKLLHGMRESRSTETLQSMMRLRQVIAGWASAPLSYALTAVEA